ncbi:hypothetical protein BD324DRAFT_619238 [Kockovaella imperatae]|uniref:HIT-type domain-containing protein n=1 Tax=Kockovaella imperatae TaxID=4999 RepID=A0A1Y1UPC5_9TREE|nr:hypothetical protein BD324DRAFT_619238 [Kockovaella imperatae]ORX39316.1 hypothetical protein BD324DRAFT_619238 [Kockovaella imperatae]
MSIKHPKQKQIRFPFSVPKPGLTTALTRVCGICRKKDSNYTCPRCNIAYCSLECFRAESHGQCSEPFYRSTIFSEIATDPKVDNDEKRKMMEMLKRFEDAQIEGEEAFEQLKRQEEEYADDQLLSALKGVDLDTISSNDLLKILPESDREAFIALLQNPDSETTRRILDAAVAEDEDAPAQLPWWENGLRFGDEDPLDEGEYAIPPEMVPAELLSSVRPPEGTGRKLFYNVLAVCISYVHILLSYRITSLSPNSLAEGGVSGPEIKAEVSAFVPFLTDSKSTTRFETVRDAWSAVWDIIEQAGVEGTSTENLVRLLEHMSGLIHPSLSLDEPNKVTLVCCDLYRLFVIPKPGAAAPRKLLFYIASLGQLLRADWLELEKEIRVEVQKLRAEVDSDIEQDKQTDRPALQVVSV